MLEDLKIGKNIIGAKFFFIKVPYLLKDTSKYCKLERKTYFGPKIIFWTDF